MSVNDSLQQPIIFKFADELSLHVVRLVNGLQFELWGHSKMWSTGELIFPSPVAGFAVSQDRRGVRLEVSANDSRYHARLRSIPNMTAVQIVERCRGPVEKWEWKFTGSKIISHRQLAAVEWERPTLRLGAFTQYGQLFDYKDWAFSQSGAECNGIVKPGRRQVVAPKSILHPCSAGRRWNDARHALARRDRCGAIGPSKSIRAANLSSGPRHRRAGPDSDTHGHRLFRSAHRSRGLGERRWSARWAPIVPNDWRH